MARRPRPSARVYRALLRLYPRPFRERHGDEMTRLFRDRVEDAAERGGWAALPRLWLATLRDVAVNGVAERWAGLRAGGRVRRWDHGTGKGGGDSMDAVAKDLRYAFRALVRSPGFTAVAVVTIALGIGANTAIFSVVRAVLMEPLPYESPDELFILWGRMTARDVEHFPHSPPNLREYREGGSAWSELAGIFAFDQPLTSDDGATPQQIPTAGVTPNFFGLLGVEPALGRDFTPEDGVPAAPGAVPGDPGFPVAAGILSWELWQTRYGGDPSVLGRIVEIGGQPTEVVGVAPQGLRILLPGASAVPPRVDAFLALRLDFDNAPRNNVFLQILGRLRPGASIEQAQREADRIAEALRARFEISRTAGFALRVEPLHDALVGGVRPVVMALLGAVAFVLLIACANVANLLLVRAASREREMAVRAAVGGGRGRIVRQMLAESVMLSFAGAALGLALASVGIDLLLALRPDDLPRVEDVRIDGSVLLFTAGAALGAALLFGLVPAIRASRPRLADALKDRGRSASLGGQRTLRNAVVVAEVALSMVLLVGAGLMIRSFTELQRVDPGYDVEGLVTVSVPVPFGRYPSAAERNRLGESIRERLASLPGVESVSGVFPLPLTSLQFNGRWGLEEALADPSAFRQADFHGVQPDYFRTMGTRVLEGRGFTEAEHTDSASVVVVDRTFAERAFPGRSPVGERILVRAITPEPVWVEVVGVVEPRRHTSLAQEGRETIYFTDRYVGSFGPVWTLRTALPAETLAPGIRAAVAEVDPELPVAEVRPMSALVDRAMAPTRFALVLIGVFAGLALVLASVGLYGVLSHVVGQRRSEIGIRMAFGARAERVVALVLREGMTLIAVGIAVGLAAALALTGLMRSLLVGVGPTDPLTFAGVAAVFLAVGAAASALPAIRASRVDPVVALREE